MLYIRHTAATMPLEGAMPARGVQVIRLEALRKRQASTQMELAEAAGVHRQTVVRAENGQTVDLSVIRKLAKALGVSPARLIAGEDS